MSELVCHLEGKINFSISECGKTRDEMCMDNEFDVIRNVHWVNCPKCLSSPRYTELIVSKTLQRMLQ